MEWTPFETSGFPPISKEEWREKVDKDLKGKAYEELLWELDESILVEPLFTKKELDFEFNIPPRSFQSERNEWQIHQEFSYHKKDLNQKILSALINGTSSIGLLASQINSNSGLFEGVHLNMISIRVILDEPLDFSKVQGCEQINLVQNYTDINELLAQPEVKRQVSIDVASYMEKGLGVIKSTILGLSSAYDLLSRCVGLGSSIDDMAPLVEFRVSVGKNYLVDIAQLRAVRVLWAKLIESFSPEHECSKVVHVHADTSGYNLSSLDEHNNLLRATTAAMSAAIGGADSIQVLPFDFWWDESEEGMRYARNIHHLLIEEAYADAVKDPLKGSYLVEHLTQILVKEIWEGVIEFIDDGGIRGSESKIDAWIKKAQEKTVEKLSNDDIQLIGVNHHPPKNSEAKEIQNRSISGFPSQRWADKYEKATQS
ncbi:MAG: methylmalonyl-CoA mutase family protein [Flavobacteriales bacterium]